MSRQRCLWSEHSWPHSVTSSGKQPSFRSTRCRQHWRSQPMAEHHSHEPSGPTEAELQESIAAGYEKNDVSLSVLIRWGLGLGVFMVATSAAALILFTILQRPPFGPPALGISF